MIEVLDMNRTFLVGEQRVHALNDINMTIEPGEYLSVMGPSGSGKSTLLNMLGLLDRPDDGQYLLNGTDTVALREEQRARMRRESIGFVFQVFHLIERLSAFENIELPLVLAGIERKRRRKMVMETMETLGIAERATHLPHQLSGGQRQRVAIGRAIVMKPSLLLADEPTGNLDSRSGSEVIGVLESLNQQGITLLVVTHDIDIGKRADRHVRMVDGAIVQDNHDAIG